jgi:hypothetical protein
VPRAARLSKTAILPKRCVTAVGRHRIRLGDDAGMRRLKPCTVASPPCPVLRGRRWRCRRPRRSDHRRPGLAGQPPPASSCSASSRRFPCCCRRCSPASPWWRWSCSSSGTSSRCSCCRLGWSPPPPRPSASAWSARSIWTGPAGWTAPPCWPRCASRRSMPGTRRRTSTCSATRPSTRSPGSGSWATTRCRSRCSRPSSAPSRMSRSGPPGSIRTRRPDSSTRSTPTCSRGCWPSAVGWAATACCCGSTR